MKNSLVNMLNWKRRAQAAALFCVASGLMACGQTTQDSSYYLDQITDSEWATAEASPIRFRMTRTTSTREFLINGQGTGVTPELNLVAGKAYVIEFDMAGYVDSGSSDNDTRHNIKMTSTTVPDFWNSIAVEKFTTANAEYRMTKLQDVVFLSPVATSVSTCVTASTGTPCASLKSKLYFVPVVAGSYTMRCAPHSSMDVKVNITGQGAVLNHKYVEGFNVAAQTTWQLNTSAPTGWSVSTSTGGLMTGSNVRATVNGSGLTFTSGSLVKDTKSVLRVSKASDFSDSVTLESDLFNESTFAWVGDKHARVVPYGLKSVKMLSGASSSSQVTNETHLKYDGYVDFYIQPKTSGTYDVKVNGSQTGAIEI